jgi:hypothetical protein
MAIEDLFLPADGKVSPEITILVKGRTSLGFCHEDFFIPRCPVR